MPDIRSTSSGHRGAIGTHSLSDLLTLIAIHTDGISPATSRTRSSFWHVLSLYGDALAIISMAAEIEPDRKELTDWYQTVPIREFGDRCAIDLVAAGEGHLVADFLTAIRIGCRG